MQGHLRAIESIYGVKADLVYTPPIHQGRMKSISYPAIMNRNVRYTIMKCMKDPIRMNI